MSALLKNSNYGWNDLVKDIAVAMNRETGNIMGEKQYPMIESRMKRRCAELGYSSAADYQKFWMGNKDAENKHLVGLLTTHFTSFFREYSHFEWIAKELPLLVEAAKKEGRNTLKIWSAACSKGQEVWSLCMWLEFHMPKIDPKMNWIVYGSDIDPVSVKEAQNGVYHRRELETAPRNLWEGHWVKGKGEIADWYKIKPELKAKTKFQVMNLLNIQSTEKYDVILCRNVLIYFERSKQEDIARSLLKLLTNEGTLITGMSESLSGYGLPLKGVSPSVYKPQTAKVIPLPVASKKAVTEELPKPLKVLCVDDSPTVLTILKKVLKAPDFEVIGTACNGFDAIEKLKTLSPDVITLDLHMPEMDGPTFLKTSGVAKKIPVVIVSSVGREHAPMMAPLGDMGISDFVEKPTLSNINEIGEELAQKLRMGWMTRNNKTSFKSAVVPMKSARSACNVVINFGKADEKNVVTVLKSSSWKNDNLVFSFSGSAAEFIDIRSRLESFSSGAGKFTFIHRQDLSSLSHPSTFWLHFKGGSFEFLKNSKKINDYIIAEEFSVPSSFLPEVDDESPVTSFSYMIEKLSGRK